MAHQMAKRMVGAPTITTMPDTTSARVPYLSPARTIAPDRRAVAAQETLSPIPLKSSFSRLPRPTMMENEAGITDKASKLSSNLECLVIAVGSPLTTPAYLWGRYRFGYLATTE